jgi:hypothetical protein
MATSVNFQVLSYSANQVYAIVDGKKNVFGQTEHSDVYLISPTSKIFVGSDKKNYSIDASLLLNNYSSDGTGQVIVVKLFDTTPSSCNASGNLTVCLNLTD